MNKEVKDFYKFKPDKNTKTIETVDIKTKRKTVKNIYHLEDIGGCVALKTSDTCIYQFSVERINNMLKLELKSLEELEEFIQQADDKLIAKIIDKDNNIFNQKIEYNFIPDSSTK